MDQDTALIDAPAVAATDMPPAAHPVEVPAGGDEASIEETRIGETLIGEMLIEEISIDGMCGVY